MRLFLEKGLDTAFDLDGKGLAAAIKRLAYCYAYPAFGNAVFLDIRALHAVEPDADVPGQELFVVVAARGIDAKAVWQQVGHLSSPKDEEIYRPGTQLIYLQKQGSPDDWGIRLGRDIFARVPVLDRKDVGIGGTSVVLKRRFALNYASALGLEAGIDFPTARPGLHAGSGGTDLFINGIYGSDFGTGLHADASLGVTRMGTVPRAVSRNQILWAVAVSRGLPGLPPQRNPRGRSSSATPFC
jgi:hypothetical protein